MSTSKLLFALAIAVTSPAVSESSAAEPAPKEAIEKFKALQEEFKARHELYWQLAEHATDDEYEKMSAAMYPSETMVMQFLLLEEQNRGNRVGLSCLHHLVSRSSGRGSRSLATRGKQIALNLLCEHYSTDPELGLVLEETDAVSDLSEETARLLYVGAESPHAQVRAAALYTMAIHQRWRTVEHQSVRQRLALLTEAGDERTEHQTKLFDALKHTYETYYASMEEQQYSRRRAVEILDRIIQEHAALRSFARIGTGPILIGPQTESDRLNQPTYGELAQRLKFELTHLSIGQKIPDINRPDAFGKPLRLHDQLGKVTVLMFSFKGCGPCEGMYPENRQLITEMKDRPFAFVGVMGDEDIETTRAAVETGDITWPVWWAGPDRELADKWNVKGWPEIFVIDHTGTIRYKELRFGLLTRAVRKLVAEAEAAE